MLSVQLDDQPASTLRWRQAALGLPFPTRAVAHRAVGPAAMSGLGVLPRRAAQDQLVVIHERCSSPDRSISAMGGVSTGLCTSMPMSMTESTFNRASSSLVM